MEVLDLKKDHLISYQQDFEKFYLYAIGVYEANYQPLVNKQTKCRFEVL